MADACFGKSLLQEKCNLSVLLVTTYISCLTRSTSDQLEMRQACQDSPTRLADLLDLVGLADLVSLANLTDLTYLTNQQPGWLFQLT